MKRCMRQQSKLKRHLLEASPKRAPRPINDERSAYRIVGARTKQETRSTKRLNSEVRSSDLPSSGATVPDIGPAWPKSVVNLPYVVPKPTNGLNPLRTHTKGPQHRLPDPHKIGPISAPILYGFATQDQDHIFSNLVRIYSKNNRNHHGYIKRRSALSRYVF
ncbi:hypothetical protein PIB30_049890 [Stylosanthes scabra]|uniref:Uncharacterized protein n=1 Tax=Stylosanthes scabra TaxID=79078 RepID=A0ABU6XGC0_9FABA|nr:hypothetical protein [Stylosanthes scabra]